MYLCIESQSVKQIGLYCSSNNIMKLSYASVIYIINVCFYVYVYINISMYLCIHPSIHVCVTQHPQPESDKHIGLYCSNNNIMKLSSPS